MKSILNSVTTDDMIINKAGLLIFKTKQNTSIITRAVELAGEFKRRLLKRGKTNEVLQIHHEDDIQSIDLKNLEGAYREARNNAIANIATAADIPAILLKDESFTQGFADGTEDSKAIAQYGDTIRQQIDPVIEYFEKIVMHLAWTESFYYSLQQTYPDIITKSYSEMFYLWQDTFSASWPSLLRNTEDKQIKSDSDKIETVTRLVYSMLPNLDPENRAETLCWLADVINSTKTYENTQLTLDKEKIELFEPNFDESESLINWTK